MLYQILDNYPPLPAYIIESIYELLGSVENKNALGNFNAPSVVVNDIEMTYGNISNQSQLGLTDTSLIHLYPDVATFSFVQAPDDVCKWVADNISKQCIPFVQMFANGSFFFPHIDSIRKKAFNYIIETGGEAVTTCFYKTKEQYQHLEATPRSFIEYDKIDLVDSVVLPANVWHSLDVTQIHSVEHIDPTKKRISLSLSFL